MALLSTIEIIDLWPSAVELGADLHIKPDTVRKWRQRGRIPSEHLAAVHKAAAERAAKAETKVLAAKFRRVTPTVLMQACAQAG